MYDYEKFSRALASIDIPRSKFSRSYGNKTTFDNGQLIPIMLEPVLPGDTFNMKSCNAVVRLSSPLKTPIYDDLYCDIYFFFVPHRLVWKHWKNFMFENTDGKWVESTEYTIPQVTSPASTGWNSKTLADYLFIRPGIAGLSVNALRFRSYCLIYNEWFRDQNLIDPVYFDDGDSTITGTNGTDEVNDTVKGSCVLKVSRFKDYMSSALPNPQKGPDVILPLGDNAPVYTGDEQSYSQLSKHFYDVGSGVLGTKPFLMGRAVDSNPNVIVHPNGPLGTYTAGSSGLVGVSSSTFTRDSYVSPTNLYTDLSSATATTINALRSCFQLQKFYERLSIGGSRYTETIRAFFNVQSSDARLQRPEFLAGDRFPVNINQVVQNTPNSDGKLGSVGAYSLSFMAGASFLKSFEEHGYIMGLMCTRHHHTYQQGIDKDAFKKVFTDYYFPVFNNLGESPIYNREIFAQGTSADSEVFGYNESFADYRSPVNRLTGEFRSDYSQSLDSWHLADDYSSLPILSKDWIEEQPITLDRVIQVAHTNANQFIADIHFDLEVSRCMSEYAIPGLIDHH